MRPNLSLVVFAAIFLASCRSAQPVSGDPDWKVRLDESKRTPRIIVQLCTPVSTPNFGVGLILRWSIGGGTEQKTGVTTEGQTIYETYADLPGDTVAITAKPSRTSALAHVFFPPKEIVTSNWSNWYPPSIETDEKNFDLKLFHGKLSQTLPISKDAPKIRYILMPFNDYLERVKQRRLGQFKEIVPPC